MILDSLLKPNPYGKNPRIQEKIRCSQLQGVPDEVSEIIDNLMKFSKNEKQKKELTALRKSGSQKIWTKSMGGRSRIRKRKTRRRKRKTRKRKRKTRRKRH